MNEPIVPTSAIWMWISLLSSPIVVGKWVIAKAITASGRRIALRGSIVSPLSWLVWKFAFTAIWELF